MTRHGSPELDADADKLIAMGEDPGVTIDDIEDGFDQWIDTLEIDVIQFEFGYEPGEFTVYQDHWRALYDEGLTPRQAWQRALDALKAERAEDDRLAAENWARIQEQDRLAIAAHKAKP